MGWIARQDLAVATEVGDFIDIPENSYRLQPQRPLTYTRPELRHTWQEGDTIESVALKYGQNAEEILDLNLIEEHELNLGDELKIPSKQIVKRSRKIRHVALEHPVDMYVNKPEGIQKYAFGNISDPDTVSGTGHFPLGTKITIHGIAHVPVGESDFLAYYMDRHAFGEYNTTKKIAWNVGYAWSELTEGIYVAPEEQVQQPTILDEPDEPITMFDDIPEPEPSPVIEKPKRQDGVLVPLNQDYTPEKYLYESDIELHELHERHAPIQRRRHDPVWIIGTFLHEGEEFYQPGKNIGEVVESGLLWPIPMDALVPENEMFDFSIKRRGMTRQEQWYELLAKVGAHYTKLVEQIKQKQQNKE